MKHTLLSRIAAICLLLPGAMASQAQQNTGNDPVLKAMQEEADRSLQGFSLNGFSTPFYISINVIDNDLLSIRTSWGCVDNSSKNKIRYGIVTLLAGDYQSNNNMYEAQTNRFMELPWASPDCTEAIRTVLWRNLDQLYRTNAANLKKKTSVISRLNLSDEDKSIPDFSKEKPITFFQQDVKLTVDEKELTEYVTYCSGYFRNYPELYAAKANLNINNQVTRFYNTEGTYSRKVKPIMEISVMLNGRDNDNGNHAHNFSIKGDPEKGFPGRKELTQRLEAEMKIMHAKINSPVVNDTHFGPVLFDNEGVVSLFANTLTNSTEGVWTRRSKINPSPYGYQAAYTGNPTEQMINKKVIARDLTVKFINSTEFYNGERLSGYTPVDDEGVAFEKELTVIKDGVLVQMLNTRTPTRLYKQSTGTSSLNSNIIQVTSNNTCSREELKKKLIEAAKKEDCDYAYIIRESNPGYFYRVDLNTGEEQLVRGMELKERFNMRRLRHILGASSEEEVHNNSMGNTFILPQSILLEEVELIQKKNVKEPPFILPKPEMEAK